MTDRFIRFHCLLWQIGVYFSLRRHIGDLHPDVIQHLTWGVCRIPCLLGLLGVPTVFGPVGGGETAPFRLRYKFSLRAHVFEILRDGLNRFVTIDPLMWLTFSRSTLIAVRTDETRRLIPRRFHNKIFKHSELTISRAELDEAVVKPAATASHPLRVLFVGRLVFWKGIYYALASFRRLLDVAPDAEFTIVGQGADMRLLHFHAAQLGIENRIRWIERVEHSRIHELYREHDVFLFPSLHDSGGTVVLEALSNGLPVISLDLGGPAEIVTESCGRIVRTAGLCPKDVIDRLADRLQELRDPELRAKLAAGALERAAEFVSERHVGGFYEIVKAAIGPSSSQPETVGGSPLLDAQSDKTPARV